MIQTSRLTLRKFIKEDHQQVIPLLMDPDFMAFSPTGSMSQQQAESRFEALVRAFSVKGIGKLAVIETVSDELIGYCGIESFPDKGQDAVELGYRLKTSARGKGYAEEASHAVLSFALQMGYQHIIALVDLQNAASHHILLKLGFERREQGAYQGMPVQFYEKKLSSPASVSQLFNCD
ncbi:GNAT family N-acetyltransferase [Photobacterium sp. GJ3]|uniref:GNAT family N-acetyltransferase n=1 Tax=Photobacterium sp. GJ3 TaxID=2829502 RepID=UPI001B8D1450|nr:GNAT family N-acetyltransferase [Photobacterium sp. GJ3]QUJ66224.1 GNAT family N-acetyltransferase [Photobacterium sp. GJ3]